MMVPQADGEQAMTGALPGAVAPARRCEVREGASARTVAKSASATRLGGEGPSPLRAASKIPSSDAIRPHAGVPRAAALAALCIVAAGIGVTCWRFVPDMVKWLLDAEAVHAFVSEHALASRVAMVGINVLQVVLAFLPGEPVELASGYAFGFWEGTALCLIASALATSAIFWGVRRWGWRLIGVFFDRDMLGRFSWLQHTRRLELVMLVVFLIPGTPKDFLTYFAGLTRMRFLPVLLIATFGRLPSIVTSTLTASALGDGDYVLAIVVAAIAVALIGMGTLIYRRMAVKR